ncbi:predicted protein [Micromonas commoda]|uniref:Uncharacterized protein n=1 Tax=Micromonas commoda (strain RCC299 / NOUM17 / CCMP2709) TaxID=296587 RepID=C1EDQ9_MICCC|nr:predicted protein [Micromonas commoda]ACO66097.1 predicted protein [Micromonas commoda]|eukprot:XP_002504839.1 predicted protein [Micromonas commoda]
MRAPALTSSGSPPVGRVRAMWAHAKSFQRWSGCTQVALTFFRRYVSEGPAARREATERIRFNRKSPRSQTLARLSSHLVVQSTVPSLRSLFPPERVVSQRVRQLGRSVGQTEDAKHQQRRPDGDHHPERQRQRRVRRVGVAHLHRFRRLWAVQGVLLDRADAGDATAGK